MGIGPLGALGHWGKGLLSFWSVWPGFPGPFSLREYSNGNRTLTEEGSSPKHAGRPVKAGEIVRVDIDMVIGNDITPHLHPAFEESGAKEAGQSRRICHRPWDHLNSPAKGIGRAKPGPRIRPGSFGLKARVWEYSFDRRKGIGGIRGTPWVGPGKRGAVGPPGRNWSTGGGVAPLVAPGARGALKTRGGGNGDKLAPNTPGGRGV